MNSSGSNCVADSSFGPVVEDCPRTFDFTLTFEESILSILPSVLLILLAPIRIISLRHQRPRVGGRHFQLIKLTAIAVFAVLQIAVLVTRSVSNKQRTPTSIGSAVLSFVDALVFCLLSYTEHSRSLRPSTLLGVYLFFSLLFDAVRIRSIWLTQYDVVLRGLFVASLVFKVPILLLEAKEKRQYLNYSDKQKGPEETSGIFSQSVFWWLNKLIRDGFRGVLSIEDLYPIDDEMLSERLGSKFAKAWQSSRPDSKYRLLIVFTKLFWWQMLSPVFSRLILVAFTFCQPLLISRFLEFLQNREESIDIGYGLIGAYAIVYFGIAISTGFYWHRVYRWITMVRGCLVSAIYYKTTEISITALDNSASVTLMSTDVERITVGLRVTHELWANFIQVCLATYLLQRELGLACIPPVVIAALSGLATLALSSTAGKRQLKWVTAIQKRVGVTSTMLSSMKGVKMSGLTSKLFDLTQRLRLDELKAAKGFRIMLIWTGVFAFLPQQFSPVFAFATFIGIESTKGRELDTTRMFTSISLLLLLSQPLSQLFQSVPTLMSAIGCFNRIQKFLEAESRSDHRLLMPASAAAQSISRPRDIGGKHSRTKLLDDIPLVELRPQTKAIASYTNYPSDVINIRDGSFGWDVDKPEFLREINLSIKKAQFTLLVGPVASGKTTLLKAMLGETPSSKGFVHISTTNFSFCDQTPWLLSQSVQKNILGFANFEKAWYNSVIYACALDEDIAVFPNGDQTLIGSSGIVLSGGQKQRVAIARAVYARREVAIFDDVFSGLDATTEQRVFTRLFGPSGLLRMSKTTIIVATHAVNLLPAADQIVALGQNGEIIEQGTFEQLNAASGYVHSFALQNAPKHTKEAEAVPETTYALARKQSAGLDHDDPDKSRQVGDFSVYRYYFKTFGRRNTIFFFTLELVFAFLDPFSTVWLKWWSDDVSSDSNSSTAMFLGVYALLQTLFLINLFVLVLHLYCYMAVQAGAALHRITLKTVMAAPMSFFSAIDTGVTLNRFSQDIQLIDGELVVALLNVVANGLACISQAILIASATFYLALTFPFLIAIFYFVQKYYLRTSRQLRFMDIEAKSPLYTQFLESLSGLSSLRAFGWQKDNQLLNNELLDSSQRPFYLLFMIQRWLVLVMDLIGMGLAVLVVGLAVKLRESVSPGFTGVALVNIIAFTETIKYTILVWTQLETAIGAVSRIKSFEATTPSENLVTEMESPPENWPIKGQVEFDGVSAAYKPETGKNALHDLSFIIKPGEKIGICGRSGSGKSSTVSALFRMIELTSGTIFIDNVDISTIPRQTVRSCLNAIPQEAYFLYGSVRSNLDPWETKTDLVLVDALKKVQLWDTVEEKGGLDTDMDVDMLSHGQRQLFCLARAILRPGNIVVLDEATSSVDVKTDELMQRIIRDEFASHTIIAVAHRLETIVDFDRILVLNKGMIEEFDTPQNLLARPSAFRELYTMKKNNGSQEST